MRFWRMIFRISISSQSVFCMIASYRDWHNSTHTVSGRSSSMTFSTSSALSRETCAVPTRMISLSSVLMRCILLLSIGIN